MRLLGDFFLSSDEALARIDRLSALIDGSAEIATAAELQRLEHSLMKAARRAGEKLLKTYRPQEIFMGETERALAAHVERSPASDRSKSLSGIELRPYRRNALPPETSRIKYALGMGWSLRYTPEFTKKISAIDRTVKGRILDVLCKLSEAPTTLNGDTQKPLNDKLEGLWRYRIGDNRLIYRPDAKQHEVILLSFGPRGDIYRNANWKPNS